MDFRPLSKTKHLLKHELEYYEQLYDCQFQGLFYVVKILNSSFYLWILIHNNTEHVSDSTTLDYSPLLTANSKVHVRVAQVRLSGSIALME